MSRPVVGIGGWTYAPWRETFFPKGLPHAQELAFASRAVTSIEINGTFYRLQSRDSFRKWAEEVPEDFVFSLKAHRMTTNRKVLAEAGEWIGRFLGSGVTELGDRLGPVLWQFAATKKFDRADFEAWLDLLPAEVEGRRLRHAVDLRHESFVDAAVIDMLRARNVAACITDSPDYPLIPDVTADFVYVRLMRNEAKRKTGYAPKDLDLWAERIRTWQTGGAPADLAHVSAKAPKKLKARDCFVYAIDGAKERAPAAAQELLKRLQAKG